MLEQHLSLPRAFLRETHGFVFVSRIGNEPLCVQPVQRVPIVTFPSAGGGELALPLLKTDEMQQGQNGVVNLVEIGAMGGNLGSGRVVMGKPERRGRGRRIDRRQCKRGQQVSWGAVRRRVCVRARRCGRAGVGSDGTGRGPNNVMRCRLRE